MLNKEPNSKFSVVLQVALTWQMMQMLYVGASGGSDHPTTTRDDPSLPPDTNPDTEASRWGTVLFKGRGANSSQDGTGSDVI